LHSVEAAASEPGVLIYWGVTPGVGKRSESLGEPIYSSPYLDATGQPALRVRGLADGSAYELAYANGLTFWVDPRGGVIWVKWSEEASRDDAVGYLLGPILGIFLRLRGRTCLHASAVAFDDRAVVFVGPPRAGKSTTAAALTKRGHTALSDDNVLLDERGTGCFWVIPSHPSLSLWPESLSFLGRSAQDLPRIFPKFEKRRLGLAGPLNHYDGRAREVGAIYLLGPREDHAEPRVESMSLQMALISLVADTYANYVLDRSGRARELEVLGRLVAGVPVRRLYGQTGALGLDRTCDLICDHYNSANVVEKF